MITAFLAVLLLQTAAPPPAPEAPVCAGILAPPAGLEAWSRPVDLSGPPEFTMGTAGDVPLLRDDDMMFAITPGRAPAPGTYGHTLDFHIAKAGTYRIALSAGAWIDVIRDGKSLTSVAHMEGARCSGIRKIVDFDLTPGNYTLQLSGAKVAKMRVLVAPK